MLDLGVPKEAVQHIKAVDEALRKVSLLISADTRQRHSAIVKAVALGIPLDAVGQPAGITRERVRQIWKNSGRTDKPWKDSRDG